MAAVKMTAFFKNREYLILAATEVAYRFERPERAWRRRDTARTVEVAVPQRYR